MECNPSNNNSDKESIVKQEALSGAFLFLNASSVNCF